VSSHPDAGRVVLSIWQDDVCRATLRLAEEDVPELVLTGVDLGSGERGATDQGRGSDACGQGRPERETVRHSASQDLQPFIDLYGR